MLEPEVRTDELGDRLRAGAVREQDALVVDVTQLGGDEAVERPRDGAGKGEGNQSGRIEEVVSFKRRISMRKLKSPV